MDLWLLQPGHKIRTRDGAEAEVLSKTEDGEWIRVRYTDTEDDPLVTGMEDLVSADEIEELLGVVNADLWDALRHRDDIKAAFDHLVEDVGLEIQKHAAAVARGDRIGDIPPEAREAIARILNGKVYIEDAEAQIARIRGYTTTAEHHEAQRDHFWRKRQEIQKSQ